MSRRFKLTFLIIVIAQVVLLLGFIADREFILQTGDEIVLETAPIDPRSLLQGDFVTLDYVIASLPSDSQIPVGTTMYVSLRDAGEVWEAVDYSPKKPSDGDAVFIKGTVDRPGHLDFGIGTYFVPENSGRPIERSADVKVVAFVDNRGRAVISDVLLDGVPFSEAMAADREFILLTSVEVVLETVPVDQGFILKDDFVGLDFVIASLPSDNQTSVGTTVYVSLREAGGVWVAQSYSPNEPSDSVAVFITGEVDRPGHLDFGVGKFFVPEDSGELRLLFEESRDVSVVASVDGRGRAVINDVLLDGVSFRGAGRQVVPVEPPPPRR